jgi:hypothetical protein
MAIVGSSVIASGGSSTIEIFNIALGPANTEQSQLLSSGQISGYLIRTRGNSELKLTHTFGESGTKYLTIPGRTSFENRASFTGVTLYFQSPQTGDTVEIWVWKN